MSTIIISTRGSGTFQKNKKQQLIDNKLMVEGVQLSLLLLTAEGQGEDDSFRDQGGKILGRPPYGSLIILKVSVHKLNLRLAFMSLVLVFYSAA